MYLEAQLSIKVANTAPAPLLLRLFWSSAVVTVVSILCGVGALEVCSVDSQLPAFSDEEGRIQRFSGALQLATVANAEAENHISGAEPFRDLHRFLETSFPTIWNRLQVRKVREWSLLIKWEGRQPSLPAVILISHQDVVPATSPEAWTHPPFSGAVADGYVWGRGALDTKNSLIAMLEAVTALLDDEYVPQRTLYLAFGHDEEVGGLGARAMAAVLAEEGVHVHCIMDEGGALLVDGFPPIFSTPLAVIATAEKGMALVKVEAKGKGGHAMAPLSPRIAPASVMARIINAVDRKQPAPRLVQPSTRMLQILGSAASSRIVGFLLRHADVWPLRPIIANLVPLTGPETNAFVRTTAVLTRLWSHPQANNVVPSVVTAIFNFRLLPGENYSFPVAFLEQIAEDERKHGATVKVTPLTTDPAMGASPVASTGSRPYRLLKQAIEETLSPREGGLVVSPWLLTGRTDSSHFRLLPGAENTYRFNPMGVNRTAGDLRTVHGVDERIGVATYLRSIACYVRFLQLVLASEPSS
eukprot:jgi/Botrbrau1/15091/Bobra.0255s0004.1